MRLWSVAPQYLDATGLVALWREALLAQKVLLGQTRGYRFHPQLNRFRACDDPVAAIGCYLLAIAKEAENRGYRFDASKIISAGPCRKLRLQQGQLEHEWRHLLDKLKIRAPDMYDRHRLLILPGTHPMFEIVPGGIEEWERV
jgi:hypothetical protein